MRARLCLLLGLMLAPAAAGALPTINSADGFIFDFYAEVGSSGFMSNGLNDAYDVCYDLYANGALFAAESGYTSTYANRGWASGYDHIGSFEVQRTAYVPAMGGNWARYIDVFTNT